MVERNALFAVVAAIASATIIFLLSDQSAQKNDATAATPIVMACDSMRVRCGKSRVFSVSYAVIVSTVATTTGATCLGNTGGIFHQCSRVACAERPISF